jgi:hypothetical protein
LWICISLVNSLRVVCRGRALSLSLSGVQTIHAGVVLLEDKIESSEEKAKRKLLSVSKIIAFESLVCEDFI